MVGCDCCDSVLSVTWLIHGYLCIGTDTSGSCSCPIQIDKHQSTRTSCVQSTCSLVASCSMIDLIANPWFLTRLCNIRESFGVQQFYQEHSFRVEFELTPLVVQPWNSSMGFLLWYKASCKLLGLYIVGDLFFVFQGHVLDKCKGWSPRFVK